MTDPVFRLGLHQSLPIFRPTVLSPGTYVYRLAPAGNSVLSTVFVKMIAVGATVDVKYYDFAAAANETPPGRYDLAAHPQISTAPITDRRIVNKIHADCLIEVIVANGSAEVAMYVSVVTDFPVELKGNTLDGQTANLLQDGGLPVSVYNPADGKFYLLRGDAGAIAVSSSLTTGKTENAVIAAANVEQSHTFPAGTKSFMMKARGAGKLKIAFDSGTSGTSYMTIWPGAFYRSPEFSSAAKIIYYQSPIAGLEVEFESWV